MKVNISSEFLCGYGFWWYGKNYDDKNYDERMTDAGFEETHWSDYTSVPLIRDFPLHENDRLFRLHFTGKEIRNLFRWIFRFNFLPAI